MLTWARRHQRRRIRHRAPPLSHHGRRRDSSGDPLSQPRAPVDAHGDGEHDGEDLVAGDLTVDELSSVNRRALLCLAVKWGQLTH